MSVVKIINVVGARPNFIKIAPIMEEMAKYRSIKPLLVHTGQHYDERMSNAFFKDLGIPRPDIDLGVGSGTHSEQTAHIMLRFEKVLNEKKPNLVLVVGDVNSTLACALVSAKLCIPVAHVEAGLRSFDKTMPEEINRVLTDALSDYLFTTCEDANENLLREGIAKERIFFVGNVMVDTLLKHREKARDRKTVERFDLSGRPYMLLTLHRPSNVDSKRNFLRIAQTIDKLSKEAPVIFPVHPRTRKRIEEFSLDIFKLHDSVTALPEKGVWMLEPLGYLDFLNLMEGAKVILTDSGGIQEESTILGVPCITLRENTERPVTVMMGTNVIAGTDPGKILKEGIRALNSSERASRIPKLWDGRTAERIVRVIVEKTTNEGIETDRCSQERTGVDAT